MKSKDIFFAIIIYMLYPLSSILMKYAAMSDNDLTKVLLFGLSIVVLGVFSILWQILLKRVDLVKAYIFKSTTIIWTVIYGIILFNENININKVLGIIIVMIGTTIVILSDNKKVKKQHE